MAMDEDGLAFWGFTRALPYAAGASKSKYMLLSSSHTGEPSLAGHPKYHVAGRTFRADELGITEGVIKAEIMAWQLRLRVIGLYSPVADDATLAKVVRLVREWS
jgi:hypothetical protein